MHSNNKTKLSEIMEKRKLKYLKLFIFYQYQIKI